MPKYTIEYNLPEEQHQLDVAMSAEKMFGFIHTLRKDLQLAQRFKSSTAPDELAAEICAQIDHLSLPPSP